MGYGMHLNQTATRALFMFPVSFINLNPKVVPAGTATGVAKISV